MECRSDATGVLAPGCSFVIFSVAMGVRLATFTSREGALAYARDFGLAAVRGGETRLRPGYEILEIPISDQDVA